MAHTLNEAVTDQLTLMLRRFCADDQQEGSWNRTMADGGHPLAHPYRRLRHFFDSLHFPSNPGARLFSYASATEHAEYWAPALRLSACPTDAKLSTFRNVAPGHWRWPTYVAAAAAAGWPEGAGPALWPGHWFVRTGLAGLRADLIALAEQGVKATATRYGGPTLVLNLSGSGDAVRQQAAILRVLLRHHRPWLIYRNAISAGWPPAPSPASELAA